MCKYEYKVEFNDDMIDTCGSIDCKKFICIDCTHKCESSNKNICKDCLLMPCLYTLNERPLSRSCRHGKFKDYRYKMIRPELSDCDIIFQRT